MERTPRPGDRHGITLAKGAATGGRPVAPPPYLPSSPAARRAAAAAAASPPARNLEQALDRLSEDIERWKLESERFFSGGAQLPPDEQKGRIAATLRELRDANMKSSGDQFRFAGLEARFNSYSELFGRRLREREEGRGRSVAPPRLRETPALDPLAGIVVADRLEAPVVEALFGALARSGSAPASLDLETFRAFLERQVSGIRAKTGAERVQLRLAEEEGKLRLKAKPVGD